MSATKFIIRSNEYFDSVFLMGINKNLMSINGVIQSAVLMGTQSNKQLLADIKVMDPHIDNAKANDLIVAVIAETNELADQALGQLDDLLSGTRSASKEINLRTLNDGLRVKQNANLAMISVPGEFAAREAKSALENGLNVFLFSSNVSVADELDLKITARDKELLVMGPDCGTSLLGGKGIGFANRVRQGPIGVIGPSGTGLQEFTCMVHNSGSGISHAIGTGSRDLKDEIGGITTMAALDLLERDFATEVVAIVSKPAGPMTLKKVIARLHSYQKPVVACFLGSQLETNYEKSNLVFSKMIDDAVEKSINLLDGSQTVERATIDKAILEQEVKLLNPEQEFVRGLFAGGTFCYQSQQILMDAGLVLHSNEPLTGAKRLDDPDKSVGNTLVDMGDEFYTLGKPHPMIDGTMRARRILTEASDPQTAVILLDFILGFNAANDPVGETIEFIQEARSIADSEDRHLVFIASITGTEDDSQDLKLQREMLEEVGVLTTLSNGAATGLCLELVELIRNNE